ncbi:hypothetical protein PSFL111601_09410 [Pseudomonas floridensis]
MVLLVLFLPGKKNAYLTLILRFRPTAVMFLIHTLSLEMMAPFPPMVDIYIHIGILMLLR